MPSRPAKPAPAAPIATEPAAETSSPPFVGARWPSFLVLGALTLVFLAVAIQKIYVPDIWWQMRMGQLVLESGWPRVDTLSYTAAGNPWIEMRWIFGVLAYLLWKLGGAAALIIVQTILFAVVFTLLCWRSRRTLLTLPGLLTLTLALGTVQVRFGIRPEMMTYLFSAIAIVLLDRGVSPGATAADRKRLWLLPLVQILWTNSHTVFIFGPIFAWGFFGGDVVHRYFRRLNTLRHTANAHQPGAFIDRQLLFVALAVSAATLVNPYFLEGAKFPFLLFQETLTGQVARVIEELAPPFEIARWTPDLWAAAAFVVWSGFVQLLGLSRFNLIRLGLWASFLYLFWGAVRNGGPFGFVALWATLRTLDDLRDAGPIARLWQPSRLAALERFLAPMLKIALAAALLWLAWYQATDRYGNNFRSKRRFGVGITPWVIPMDAVEWMKRHKLLGPVLHSMDDGAYMSFAAPEYKVWVDGRLEVYNTNGKSIFPLIDTLTMATDWRNFSGAHGFNTVLVQRDSFFALFDPLMSDPNWALVYMDSHALIWVKHIAEHAKLIDEFRVNPYQPWQPREPEPQQHPPAWARALGAQGLSWHFAGMASNFLRLRAIDNWQATLERGVKEFPGDRQLNLALAQAYRAAGDEAKAADIESRFVPIPEEVEFNKTMVKYVQDVRRALANTPNPTAAVPENPIALASRANDAFAARDFAAAADLYAKLAALRPDIAETWIRLASCYDNIGKPADAANAYRQVILLRPGDFTVYYNLGQCLLETGDIVNAKAAFEEALRLNPDSPDARKMVERFKTPATSPLAPLPSPR